MGKERKTSPKPERNVDMTYICGNKSHVWPRTDTLEMDLVSNSWLVAKMHSSDFNSTFKQNVKPLIWLVINNEQHNRSWKWRIFLKGQVCVQTLMQMLWANQVLRMFSLFSLPQSHCKFGCKIWTFCFESKRRSDPIVIFVPLAAEWFENGLNS